MVWLHGAAQLYQAGLYSHEPARVPERLNSIRQDRLNKVT